MNEKYKNIPISTPIEPEIELDGGYLSTLLYRVELLSITMPSLWSNHRLVVDE